MIERADRSTQLLITFDLVRLAAIVFLPVPTSLVSTEDRRDALGVSLHVGTMLVAMIAIRRRRSRSRCAAEEVPRPGPARLALERVPVVLMALAFVGTVLGFGASALEVLLLTIPAGRLQRVVLRRRAASRS